MKKNRKPHGRDEVTKALMEAAAELFARHGIDGVSVRDIARKARVNHGLIYRHFGSKENLLRKTQEHIASRIRMEITPDMSLEEAAIMALESLRKDEVFWKIHARSILDGIDAKEIQKYFPVADHFITLVQEAIEAGSIRKDLDPRILVASMFALAYGLQVFEAYIFSAVGLSGENPETIRSQILDTAISLMSTVK